MVFTGRNGWALHVPMLFLWASLIACGGAYFALTEFVNWKTIGGGLLALAFAAFTLSQLRWIRTRRRDLLIGNVYGTDRLPVQEVALGVSIHHGGRGGPHYTIYASTSLGQRDLASAMTRKGAERLRARLTATLLGGRIPSETTRSAEALVAKKEAKRDAQSREAQAKVDEYYASGGAKKATLLILGFIVLYSLGMGVFFWVRS